MNEFYTHLFFSKKRGYIVKPDGISPLTGGPKGMRPPHTFKLPADTSAKELGAALARAHADSLAHQHMEEQGCTDKELLSFAGVRGWRQFDKEYRSLLISYDGHEIVVLESFTDKDGYSPWPTKERSPYEVVPEGASDEEVGTAVLKLLAHQPQDTATAYRSFETLAGASVTYKEPPECLEFLGDAHTDAYEVWGVPEDSSSHAALMIDSGYDREGSGFDDITRESVHAAWERWHGPLRSFESGQEDVNIWWTQAEGAAGQYIFSRFLPDADGRPFEATATILPHVTEEVREALLSVVHTVRIDS